MSLRAERRMWLRDGRQRLERGPSRSLPRARGPTAFVSAWLPRGAVHGVPLSTSFMLLSMPQPPTASPGTSGTGSGHRPVMGPSWGVSALSGARWGWPWPLGPDTDPRAGQT